jgi:hypothetical protein
MQHGYIVFMVGYSLRYLRILPLVHSPSNSNQWQHHLDHTKAQPPLFATSRLISCNPVGSNHVLIGTTIMCCLVSILLHTSLRMEFFRPERNIRHGTGYGAYTVLLAGGIPGSALSSRISHRPVILAKLEFLARSREANG